MPLPTRYEAARNRLRAGDTIRYGRGSYKVTYVRHIHGHGVGMGEQPPVVLVVLDNGFVFEYDPWATPQRRKVDK